MAGEQDARARAIGEQARQIANRWWRSRDASPDAEVPDSLAETIAVALSLASDTAHDEAVTILKALRDRLRDRSHALGVQKAIEVLQGNKHGW